MKNSACQGFFSEDAVAHFARLSKARQRRLLDRVAELTHDPFVTPDLEALDTDGRKIALLDVGGFVLTYWVDHAAKQVLIVSLEEG